MYMRNFSGLAELAACRVVRAVGQLGEVLRPVDVLGEVPAPRRCPRAERLSSSSPAVDRSDSTIGG